MRDGYKLTIFALTCALVFSVTLNFIFASRTFEDGIIKAERHHLLTGDYYNTYNKTITFTEKDTITDYQPVVIAPFEETYWEDIP